MTSLLICPIREVTTDELFCKNVDEPFINVSYEIFIISVLPYKKLILFLNFL